MSLLGRVVDDLFSLLSRNPTLGRIIRDFLLWYRDNFTRVVWWTLLAGFFWMVMGGIDALMVRLQESAWVASQQLIFTNTQYYAAITLHAMRALFLFAMPIFLMITSYLMIRLYGVEPRHVGWLWMGWFLNEVVAGIFWEGPILLDPRFFDAYFSATMWYSLAPLGLPQYSSYVVSPFWYLGWVLHIIFIYLWVAWMIYHMRYVRDRGYVWAFIVSTVFLVAIGYVGVAASTVWLLIAWFSYPLDPLINQVFFWVFGHAIVYMALLPALTILYALVPALAGVKLYSEGAAVAAAYLYLMASAVVPIHHLYVTPLPNVVKYVTAVLTYIVVIPSVMTVFNLWATTALSRSFKWSVPAAFTVLAFYALLVGGVTGIINGDPASAPIIHNTEWVPAHFHAVIWSLLAAGFAGLYVVIPWITGRMWYSRRLAWLHFWLTTVSVVGMSIGFFTLAADPAAIRRVQLLQLTNPLGTYGNLILTASSLIFGLAQLFFLVNAVNTLFIGSRVTARNLLEIVSRVSHHLSPVMGKPLVGSANFPLIVTGMIILALGYLAHLVMGYSGDVLFTALLVIGTAALTYGLFKLFVR